MGAVVVADLGWVAWLLAHSWFFLDDFLRLGEAVRGHLGWAYLSAPIDNHLGLGWRAAALVLVRVFGVSYGPVVVAEMLVQAVAVVGLLRILTTLLGRRPLVLGLGVAYIVCPLALSNEVSGRERPPHPADRRRPTLVHRRLSPLASQR